MGRIIIAEVVAAQDGAIAEAPPTPQLVLTPPTIDQTPSATADEFTADPVRGARKLTAQQTHASLANSAQPTLTRYAKAKAAPEICEMPPARDRRRLPASHWPERFDHALQPRVR